MPRAFCVGLQDAPEQRQNPPAPTTHPGEELPIHVDLQTVGNFVMKETMESINVIRFFYHNVDLLILHVPSSDSDYGFKIGLLTSPTGTGSDTHRITEQFRVEGTLNPILAPAMGWLHLTRSSCPWPHLAWPLMPLRLISLNLF